MFNEKLTQSKHTQTYMENRLDSFALHFMSNSNKMNVLFEIQYFSHKMTHKLHRKHLNLQLISYSL